MDDVVDFVRTHSSLEHRARVLALTEPDIDKVTAAIRAANEAYVRGARAGIDRPEEIGEDERSRAGKAIERVTLRVRAYGDGVTYLAMVSEEWRRPYGLALAAGLFIRKQRGKLRIVARYLPCPDCDATGRVGGKRCRDCNASGWAVKATGETIDFARLGPVVRELVLHR